MKTNQIILSVRKIAEQKGISQAQIAKMLEVDRPYIRSEERRVGKEC